MNRKSLRQQRREYLSKRSKDPSYLDPNFHVFSRFSRDETKRLAQRRADAAQKEKQIKETTDLFTSCQGQVLRKKPGLVNSSRCVERIPTRGHKES